MVFDVSRSLLAEVWMFTTPEEIGRRWEQVAPRLGRRRAFWELLLGEWKRDFAPAWWSARGDGPYRFAQMAPRPDLSSSRRPATRRLLRARLTVVRLTPV